MANNIYYLKNHIEDILDLLDDVESDLKSARGWGIWDILGGKTLVGLGKHKKISRAEKKLKKVKKELESLQLELKSLDLPIKTKINAGSFNKFMDIFIDHPISNWYTQSKISDGLSEVRSIKRIVENIYYDLDNI